MGWLSSNNKRAFAEKLMKDIRAREEKEKIDIIGEISPEIQEKRNSENVQMNNSKRMQEIKEEREKEDEKQEGQLLAIHGAKVKFNAHMGEFKVLNDVPTTQGKLTGTKVEKQIPNFTFYDGFQMLSLTEWQDFGTVKVQDNEALIKKSTLPGTGKMPGNVPPESGKIEFVDSLGNFVVFLANESADMVGDFNSTIEHFYTVKVRVMNEYTYHSNFNTVTKRIYEEKYNVNTGLDSHLNLYEETEKVEFRIKKDAQQIFKESDTSETIKKQIKDYYNVNDLSKMGLKGVQKTLNILGYLDYWNDLQGIAKGEKPKIYDAVGVITTTAEIAAKAAGTTLEIPIWANAVLFGLAVFEETIVADAIRDMDECVENAMMTDLENAKLYQYFY